jgi:hypothetical protein
VIRPGRPTPRTRTAAQPPRSRPSDSIRDRAFLDGSSAQSMGRSTPRGVTAIAVFFPPWAADLPTVLVSGDALATSQT